ncbi:urease accessory UreD/UreH family protein [Adhaeribacter radiodurans]|uniref:Uncharacterized protein n=1 Tax=Adhaeribacter radiodurans TaxID=2745197 RepID=A0A7L7L1G7_9BACT|nr:hypothetical protein [Adhaeribacter radiodurans]QMU26628.1 hypothetical protein HUW48_16700 [Adhaeribacter radiodurans]
MALLPYQIEIDLKENCRLHLQTQSYQRLFRMEKGGTQTIVGNLPIAICTIFLIPWFPTKIRFLVTAIVFIWLIEPALFWE